MKNLFLSFFFLLGFSVTSQINVDSIGIYMFEMHNELRTKGGVSKRYMSKYCKQASKNHLDYIMKYGLWEAHYQTKVFVGNKILRTPNDRYNYYNRDTFKVTDLDYSWYVRQYTYDSEICTAQEMKIDVNNKNVNKVVAKLLLQNFINSKNHNFLMMDSSYSNSKSGCHIVRGYFSVDYKITNGQYNFHCVAVFDSSRSKSTELIKDYTNGYNFLYK